MQLTVVVEKILPTQQFNKRDGSIGVRNSFIARTNTGQYDKQMKFDVMNQDVWMQMAIRVGQTYDVTFDAESRAWNSPTKGEQWFTSLTAWKAVLQNMPYQQPQVPQPQYQQPQYQQPQPVQQQGTNDNIPF